MKMHSNFQMFNYFYIISVRGKFKQFQLSELMECLNNYPDEERMVCHSHSNVFSQYLKHEHLLNQAKKLFPAWWCLLIKGIILWLTHRYNYFAWRTIACPCHWIHQKPLSKIELPKSSFSVQYFSSFRIQAMEKSYLDRSSKTKDFHTIKIRRTLFNNLRSVLVLSFCLVFSIFATCCRQFLRIIDVPFVDCVK